MFRCLIKWYLTRMEEYKKMIEDALKRVYEVARKTTLDFAPEVSARHENNIWLKREDQQPVFSYKLRGAYNLMASLSEHERQKGVIAASAGNHAQGVALAGNKLGIEAVIVMIPFVHLVSCLFSGVVL